MFILLFSLDKTFLPEIVLPYLLEFKQLFLEKSSSIQLD